MKIESMRVKRSVVIDGKRYSHGDEDALNDLLNDDQKTALHERGVVTLAKRVKRSDAKRNIVGVEAG